MSRSLGRVAFFKSTKMYDRSETFSFIRPDGRTFFDFQIAAIEHCRRRLSNKEHTLLALDTGLGKTCSIRAILTQLKARAIIVVPGGLVRQVSSGLVCYPWETSSSEGASVVASAETGKQLMTHLVTCYAHQFLVVNRALLLTKSLASIVEIYGYNVIVVDEAHQPRSLSTVKKWPYSCYPILFVTASPDEGDLPFRLRNLTACRFRTDAFRDACFLVRKTLRSMEALGVAKPNLVVLKSTLEDYNEYYDTLIANIWVSNGNSPNTQLRIMLAAAHALPKAAPFFAIAILNLLENLRYRGGEIGGDCLFANMAALLSKHGHAVPADIVVGASHRRPTACDCCDLTPAELTTLHSAHAWASPEAPPPWVLMPSGFASALVRFRTRKHMEDTIEAHPIPKDILVFKLTSDKSAAYRARLVQRFASHDGQKAKLSVLTRALRDSRTCSEMLYRVGRLGLGKLFLSHIETCLARPRLLLADATVDVGFDLHRHVDGIYLSRIPSSYIELCQITGRVSRIAVDRENQGTINVFTHCAQDTLDDALFLKHLNV